MKVITPFGIGILWDRMDGGFSVRLDVNEVTNEIDLDRVITRSNKTGLFLFAENELKELK